MKWTDDQQKAISKRGGKVIVSAAAGSGKTAVLSARIIDYILKGGSIDKLLIVTFTTLAAGEMKERIRKNINDQLLKDPNNAHLQTQVLLIDQALIMTMDAFYNKLIKENFLTLNINPNFEIINETQYKIIKKNVLNQVIENNISNPDYRALFDNFSDFKNGTTIESLLTKFNEHINKFPFPEKWLNQLIDIYNVDIFENSIWSDLLYNELFEFLTDYEEIYIDLFEEIKLDDILLEKLEPFLFNELNKLKHIKENLNNNYKLLKENFNNIQFDRYPSIKDYKDHPTSLKFKAVRDFLRADIKNYNEKIFNNDDKTFSKDIKVINKMIDALIKLSIEYRHLLKQEQLKNNFLSFEDVPHLVLKLLVKDYNYTTKEAVTNPIASEIANQFDEILIDEFQDTNLLQDLIFKSISKNNNNLFIVGDAKQSIYGFRSARPDLLIDEKNKASMDSFPAIVNLSKNFRSRQDVLSFTNYVFSKTMKQQFGNIIYNESEALHLGASYPNNDKTNTEIYILSVLEDTNLEQEELNKNQSEALFITNKIKELLDSKFPIYDAKTNNNRPIQPNDIAILLRSPGDFANDVRDILSKQGIDVYTDRAPIYFDNYEIKLIISFLKIINNPYDNISLVSVLRSPLFGISEGVLLNIKLVDNQDYLFSNLLKYNNVELFNFLETYKQIKKQSTILTIDKLINYIYIKTEMFAIIGALDNGGNRIENLLEMINHAEDYKEGNLANFINYIDDLIEQQYSLEGTNPAPEKHSVLITTIHKSKGLEFPVVFLPQLDKKFNFQDLYDDILIDDDYYLSFKLRDYENFTVRTNLPLELIKMEKKNKQLAEELRVLYVALTRAKEKLILSGSVKNIESTVLKTSSLIGNSTTIPTTYIKKANSFLDWLLPLIIKHRSGQELRDFSDVDTLLYNDNVNLLVKVINSLSLIVNNNNTIPTTQKIDETFLDQVFSYQYPYSIVPQKQSTSVSEFNSYFNDYKKPKFIQSDAGLTVGTTYHNILEHIPFIIYNYETFEDAINTLLKSNIISELQLQEININKVYNFFENDLYKNSIVKSTVYKEYPITFLQNINGHDVVVEGIIDLLCIHQNNYYLIDYKSDIVDTETELIKRYKQQLDLYENALKQKGVNHIYKYIYSFNLNKFIKIK